MKLSNQHRRSTRLELSMTSMIDVVFLLLIFFLVTTTFVKPEKQIRSAIKVNEQNSANVDSDLEPAIVDVVRLNDKVVFKIGAVVTNELDEIKEILNSFENKSEGAFVRISDDIPFDFAAKVIGVCKASGFVSVSYIPLK